ncbi:MAG: exodeoxyribonuclease V subunit alpha [Marmoricola sp.]
MIEDGNDRRLALHATGLLAEFNRADVLAAADVHVADRLGTMLGETREQVLLAVALVVRAARHGSVCVDLTTIADLPLEEDAVLLWPESTPWLAAVADSPLVRERVLHLEDELLYLDRYWREEGQVCADLLARLAQPRPATYGLDLDAAVLRVFPEDGYEEQRDLIRAATGQTTTVLTGGPGTGKTTAVAGLLAIVAELHEQETGRLPRVAMCAPTAKASVRLKEAVSAEIAKFGAVDQGRLRDIPSTTLHRLLGWRVGSNNRFKHDRGNKLPHDVVVVDETSMVSLTHMARLLEALRPTTRLVLVGDSDQLASVEAGAVLADVVKGLELHPAAPVFRLRRTHRFGKRIGALADALRVGDADTVMGLLQTPSTPESDLDEGEGAGLVELVDPADAPAMARFRYEVRAMSQRVTELAEEGRSAEAIAALDEHRLLCAHREGPSGVNGWNRQVERLLTDATGVTHYEEWYAGRPVLVTANDYGLDLFNGDLGVTVRLPDGRLRVAVPGATEVRLFATTRLADVETVYAMTVHKSQGSQAKVVSVVMPPEDSPLLTRELFYTAVTRAQERVRIVGTEQAVRAAVDRQVQRASGLARRLALLRG